MAQVYQGRFCDRLRELYQAGQLEFYGQLQTLNQNANFESLLSRCNRNRWYVYAKKPFAGPSQVLRYLSRYTHRLGITNKRLEKFDQDQQTITFQYLDRTTEPWCKKSMTLQAHEFVRRLCLHILPNRFVKIRHFGILANNHRKVRIEAARRLLRSNPQPLEYQLESTENSFVPVQPVCPFCQSEDLTLLKIIYHPLVSLAPFIWDSS